MNGLRDQFFSRPTFPCYQYGDVIIEDGLSHIEDIPHSLAVSDDIVKPLPLFDRLPQLPEFILKVSPLQSSLHHHPHLVDIERFREVIVGAFPYRLDGDIL